jgi:hypothetical protein
MHRQPRIADASQLKFRIVHRYDMTARGGLLPGMATGVGGQTMTALTHR